MAQMVAITLSGNITQVEYFALNTFSIGERQENGHKRDVKLIQFFLWQFYNVNIQLFSLLPIASRTPEIVIDGKCGQQTKAGIYNFQKHHRLLGYAIPTDGVVDATKSLLTRRNAEMFTIWWLNKWFVANGTGTDQQRADLRLHPMVINRIPDLHTELCNSHVRAIA
jgi:hypothetical protein